MRTRDEIVEKIRTTDSYFGFETSVWIGYLPFELAREFLNPEVSKEDWGGGDEPLPEPLTREHVLAEMKRYMTFAIGKAIGHRGLSAGRSIDKMEAWIWLLGDDPIDAGYPNYGAPILRAICERYGWDWREIARRGGDERMFERMSEGKACRIDCDEGCDR